MLCKNTNAAVHVDSGCESLRVHSPQLAAFFGNLIPRSLLRGFLLVKAFMTSKEPLKVLRKRRYLILNSLYWKRLRVLLFKIKKDLSCNGRTPVTIKTLHGPIHFQLQRFKDSPSGDKKKETYFSLTGQFQEVYITPRLQ